jgi:predicted ATP-grasp superfamily ATP-dependent carboligase
MKALITNLAGDSGLIAARSLAEAGFKVIGADVQQLPAWFRSRYVSTYYSYGKVQDSDLFTALFHLIETVQPDVFLPIGTRSMITASMHRDTLSGITALNVVDSKAFMAAFDKAKCMAQCRQLGIPCPMSYTYEEACHALQEHADGCTIVVKPRWDVGAATGVHYVQNCNALQMAVDLCRRRFGGSVIQEFIPGGVDANKTVIVLFSPEGRLAAAFTTQKIRHWPQTGGPTAVSRSTDEPHLVETVLPFFRKWKWQGIAEIELKYDARDGQDKVIEINPRFPGYSRFAYHCGLNLPLLAVRNAMRKKDEATNRLPGYSVGVKYLAPTLFVRTVFDDIHALGLKQAMRRAQTDLHDSLPVMAGMFADPLPLFGRLLQSKQSQNAGVATLHALQQCMQLD